jgi:hypothetical protein
MYRHVYTRYNQCTNKYIQIKTHSSWYIPGVYKNKWFCNVVLCTCCLRTCSSNVWTRYIHQMYKLICLCTCFIKAKSQQGGESNPGPLSEILATLTPLLAALMQIRTKLKNLSTTQPGGWWRTSGAGPAAPPAPAITSPDRVIAGRRLGGPGAGRRWGRAGAGRPDCKIGRAW